MSFMLLMVLFPLPPAKKFGITEFINPKDHDKPVQEVHLYTFYYSIFYKSTKDTLYRINTYSKVLHISFSFLSTIGTVI